MAFHKRATALLLATLLCSSTAFAKTGKKSCCQPVGSKLSRDCCNTCDDRHLLRLRQRSYASRAGELKRPAFKLEFDWPSVGEPRPREHRQSMQIHLNDTLWLAAGTQGRKSSQVQVQPSSGGEVTKIPVQPSSGGEVTGVPVQPSSGGEVTGVPVQPSSGGEVTGVPVQPSSEGEVTGFSGLQHGLWQSAAQAIAQV